MSDAVLAPWLLLGTLVPWQHTGVSLWAPTACCDCWRQEGRDRGAVESQHSGWG